MTGAELRASEAAQAASALAAQAQALDFSAAAGYEGGYRHAFSLLVHDDVSAWTGATVAFLASPGDGPQYADGLAALASGCARELARRLKLIRSDVARRQAVAEADLAEASEAVKRPGAAGKDYDALVAAATDLKRLSQAESWLGGSGRRLPRAAQDLLGRRAAEAISGASPPPSGRRATPGPARQRELLAGWELEQLPEIAEQAAESLRRLVTSAGAEPAA